MVPPPYSAQRRTVCGKTHANLALIVIVYAVGTLPDTWRYRISALSV